MTNTNIYNMPILLPPPEESHNLPDWAEIAIDKAKISCRKTIPLTEVPTGWFEYIAFKASKLHHDGPHLAVEVAELARIVKEGRP